MSYSEISSSHPKARKEHRCEWCNQKILKGEKHFHRSYRFEGNFNNGRMHLECELAMDKSDHGDLQDGWIPGDPNRGETLDGRKVA